MRANYRRLGKWQETDEEAKCASVGLWFASMPKAAPKTKAPAKASASF
jgi:hypothetical protein